MAARPAESTATPPPGERSLVAGMRLAYRRPGLAMERQIAEELAEQRALFHLVVACILLCAASLPGALRTAGDLGVEDARTAAMASRVFGYVILLPLISYGAAGLVQLILRAARRRIAGLKVRSALFWSMVLAGPLALALSAAAAVAGPHYSAIGPWLSVLALGYWFWLFSASLAAGEANLAAGPVFAVCAACFAGVAAVIGYAA